MISSVLPLSAWQNGQTPALPLTQKGRKNTVDYYIFEPWCFPRGNEKNCTIHIIKLSYTYQEKVNLPLVIKEWPISNSIILKSSEQSSSSLSWKKESRLITSMFYRVNSTAWSMYHRTRNCYESLKNPPLKLLFPSMGVKRMHLIFLKKMQLKSNGLWIYLSNGISYWITNNH